MKKITLIALSLLLGSSIAQAEDKHDVSILQTPAALENNFRSNLWHSSRNWAGMAFHPMKAYNDLNLTYGLSDGAFRPQTIGEQENQINLNTRGAVMLGGFMLSGNFSFINRFEKKACYNTLQYEVEKDMPYFILDPNPSGWNKQEYDMGACLVSPVLAETVSLALKIDYQTKVGAKQRDPRAETYKYHVEIIPSIAVHLGKTHLLGLYGLFRNSFERAVPTLNNYMETQKIVYNKGLGEGTNGKVGDNDGLKTIYYKSLRYGGGLQYSWGEKQQFLIDLGYQGRKVEGFEQPRLPKRLGSTSATDLTGKVQVIFGSHASNKLDLDILYSTTKGTEHIQKLNPEAFNQKWEIVSSNPMSQFMNFHSRISYDHLWGNELSRGYNWKAGGNVTFSHQGDEYSIPHSTFTATNVLFGANGGKQFKFRTSTLLLGMDLGYQLNLSGSYQYGGKKKDSIQVNYYQLENDYLTSDFMKLGGRISYTLHSKKVNYFLNLTGDWRKAFSIPQHRLVCQASVGIVF